MIQFEFFKFSFVITTVKMFLHKPYSYFIYLVRIEIIIR